MQMSSQRRQVLMFGAGLILGLAVAVVLAGYAGGLFGAALNSVDMAPRWSPNAKYVVFESNRNGSRDIYMADVKSGDEARLTDSPAQDVKPNWAPDSGKIIFQTDRDGMWQIYELNLADKKAHRLSDGTSSDENAQYSPDGKWIAFNSARNGGKSVVYLMAADGSGLKPVSDPKGAVSNVVWSPDGSQITYQSDLSGKVDIYVYDISANTTRQVSSRS
jgi:TolB protein